MSLTAAPAPTRTPLAAVVTRNPAVFEDLRTTLTVMGFKRIGHLTPAQLLNSPMATWPNIFWVVDGRTPGAPALIKALLAQRRTNGVAVSTASATAFNTFCQTHGVGALLMHRDIEPPPPMSKTEKASFSAREIQILQLIAEGKSNVEIAALLHLSPLTIKSHLARMLRKAGAEDRAHLVCLGLRGGLIV